MKTPTRRSLSSLLLLVVLGVGITQASEVVVLTNENFEHLTQASTGATTGPWFVDFYAPWCGHCKHLEPTWEQVAEELKGQVNFAKVDVPANPALGSRFDIRFFPTLKYINQGTVYTYDGRRDAESISAFATEGYKEKEGEPVPPPPTLLESIKKQGVEVWVGVKTVYAELAVEVQRVFRGEKPADPQLLVVVGGIVLIFLLSGLAFVAAITASPGGAQPSETDKKTN